MTIAFLRLIFPLIFPAGRDRQTFIEHTCLKAGLPTDAWKDPETSIEIFSAQVFGELDNRLEA